MANETVYRTTDSNNLAWQEEGHWESSGLWGVGWDRDPGFDNKMNGALRIPSLPLNRGQGFYSADIVVEDISRHGESIWGKYYGIAEDNTGDFNGSNPWGRSRTSSNSDFYMYQPNGDIGFGVGGMVSEIIGRGGWNYNNAIGFVWLADNLSNHGSQSNYLLGMNWYMYIRFSAEPNFKPSPIILTSAAFSTADHYGIKISKPGVNVMTATEEQTYFTSRKRVMTVKSEALITTTANPHVVAHGLGYTPMVMAYALGSDGKQHLLPRVNYGAGGSIGWVGANNTNVEFFVPTSTQVYYYIFHDPQPA